MPDQIDSPEQLQEKVAEILTKWPLYRTFVYTGQGCHAASKPQDGYRHGSRYGLLPKEVRLFCDNKKCGYESVWETSDQIVFFGPEFINRDKYTRRNCGSNTINYCYIWQERKENSIFL